MATNTALATCVHHWMLDDHDLGQCCRCGQTRQFEPWAKFFESMNMPPVRARGIKTTLQPQKPAKPSKALAGEYQDTGCEVSPSCLSCPLPRCKYG